MKERFVRKQYISRSGEPSIRYRLEERLNPETNEVLLAAHPIGLPAELLGSPTQEDVEAVKQMRIREALLADPSLGGKIVMPVWTGELNGE